MADPALDIGNDLPGVELVPAPVQILGDGPKLDDEVPGEVLRLDLAPLLPPQPHQSDLIVAHDDPGVGAADEGTAVLLPLFPHGVFHAFPPRRNDVCWHAVYCMKQLT